MLDFDKKNILVVAAHPDDEILGLGGTINYLVNSFSCKIKVIILGEGITSRSNTRNSKNWDSDLNMHKSNVLSAKGKLEYHNLEMYDLPDNRFDEVAILDIVKIVEKEIADFEPEIIFTHHKGDLNIDHRKTYQAVITANRPMVNCKTKLILTFETPSSTEWVPFNSKDAFLPNLFVPISKKNLMRKIDAMECYEFEKREYPHPRSPKALKIVAERWGVVIGSDLAEAFSIERLIA